MPQAPKPAPGPGALRIAALLRARRQELGVTQKALAAETGLAQQTISALLLGQRTIDVDQLQLLCDALGLDVQDAMRKAYGDL